MVAAGLLVTRELAEPVALGGRNRGEAEAIALAQDLGGGTPLILDDGRARRTAQQRGLHVIGSGGVLVLAKSRHAIQSVRLELDRLRNVSLYLSEATYHALSEVAGEATAEP
ncbi:MAG: DUF3368 domain-containing protein [Dehalococcoidia bacterium]